jgi:KDO2-lipid IV(A) lauroyltransferase
MLYLMKKLWQSFVRNSFFGLLRVLRFIPWKTAQAWGRALGAVGYRLSARYRHVADKNLKIAYGDTMTERDRQRLIKGVFQSFGSSLFEFLKAPSMSADQIRKLVPVSPEQYAHIDELLARGKGLIVISAHLGNWELLARRGGMDGYNFGVVARQSPDNGLNDITDYVRNSGGYDVLARGNSAKVVMQRLKKGGIVAILPDQKSEDVFVPFFGRLTGTVAGPATLALRTESPILIVFCVRLPDGTFKIEMAPDIDQTTTGDLDADRVRIMADITAEIEKIVRKYPDQWLWLHDRWKSPIPEHLLQSEGDTVAAGTAH